MHQRKETRMDLTTTYLGLKLSNPIIAGSSGLTDSVAKIEKLAKKCPSINGYFAQSDCVVRKILSSEYQPYASGKIFRAP
jgi:isopentenyl diphosphate isomerase/L-lactate dehydrogenase-like FMN-dependent dehydrogenase